MLILALVTIGSVFLPASNAASHQPIYVSAIGDSHFEPGSALVRFLAREVGPRYRVVAEGRRGWPTRLWIRNRLAWRRVCRRSDIVLISLSGNDRVQGVPASVYKANIDRLWGWCEDQGAATTWITRPSDYVPRLQFRRDGIHLSREGARTYAKVLAGTVRRLDANRSD
jgi:lysophospholipase L1-like esterase